MILCVCVVHVASTRSIGTSDRIMINDLQQVELVQPPVGKRRVSPMGERTVDTGPGSSSPVLRLDVAEGRCWMICAPFP